MIRLTGRPSLYHTEDEHTQWIKLSSLESKFLVPAHFFKKSALLGVRLHIGKTLVKAFVFRRSWRWTLIIPQSEVLEKAVQFPSSTPSRENPFWRSTRTYHNRVLAQAPGLHFRPTPGDLQADLDNGICVRLFSGMSDVLKSSLPSVDKLEILLNSRHVAARRRR